MDTTHAPAHVPLSTYWKVGGWLAALLLTSIVLSELGLPKLTVVLSVLTLSLIKTCLVAWYYMHLKFDRRWLIGVAAFPLLLVVLAVLLVWSSRFVTL